MRTIAILCGRYLPGYKDGGPVRTLVNLVDCLGKKYRFIIITNDRDHGDSQMYPSIKYDMPNIVGDAEVWYLKPGGFHKNVILKLTQDADLIYLCGPYNNYAYRTLFLNRIGKIKQPVVVASMGSFSKGAFNIKNRKKRLFIRVCKIAGVFRNITWSVTSELEAMDVKRVIGDNAECMIAEDLPRKVPAIKERKINENLKIVFISRISEKKNLLYAIEVLEKIKSNVIFDIYGTIEDGKYWNKCQTKLKELPTNIIWQYKGIAEAEKVIDIFSEYDVFLFPTCGENYGHVIFEALAGGCIPLISDQTPWNDLEAHNCGKVLRLTSQEAFALEIDKLAELEKDDLAKMRNKAHSYAQKKYTSSIVENGYVKIFG